MNLEIHGSGNYPVRHYSPAGVQKLHTHKSQQQALKQALIAAPPQGSPVSNPERYIEDILRISRFFDRTLRFSINRELDTVVVKVIDKRTDTVIKEIPPEALQRLHQRMQEALGLLFDKEI